MKTVKTAKKTICCLVERELGPCMSSGKNVKKKTQAVWKCKLKKSKEGMQSGWRLAQQNSAFIENTVSQTTGFRILTSIKFSLLTSNDEKKSAIHMTADLQNCSKSLQTENQSQLGGLGTLT